MEVIEHSRGFIGRWVLLLIAVAFLISTFDSLAANRLSITFNQETFKKDRTLRRIGILSQFVSEKQFQTYLGYVIADESGIQDEFFAHWTSSNFEAPFYEEWGDYYQLNKDFPKALSYYILASDAADDPEERQKIENKGAISCQALFSQSDLHEKLNSYCNTYFKKNKKNLLIDGDIELGNLDYWKTRFFEKRNSATYAIQFDQNRSKYVIALEGFGNQYHGGVYQLLTILPGTCIHYSANLKLEGKDNFSSRLLYIGGESNGSPIGSQLVTVSYENQAIERGEWVLVERYINIPNSDNDLFEVFPVLVSGEGTAQIEKVSFVEVDSSFCE